MAWGVGGTIAGSIQDSTSSTSLGVWGGLAVGAADRILLTVATDNVQTTDGVTNLHTSVVTAASEVTWTKLSEFTNGQTAAAAGATVSTWISSPCPDTSLGSTTVNFASAIAKRAACWIGVSLPSGSNVQKAGTDQTRADDGIDPGAMTLGSLTSGEYLWFRGIAAETNSDNAITASSGWTPFGGGANASTTGGAAAANMAVAAEYDIATGTTLTSDPTWVAADCASVLVALQELPATLKSASDSGSGSDTAPSLGKTVTDTATAVDTVAGRAITLSDSAVATDTGGRGTDIFKDTFTRSVTDAWGTPDIGAYTAVALPSGVSCLDVASGVGTMALTANGDHLLSLGLSVADFEMSGRFQVNQLPSSSSNYVINGQVRRTSDTAGYNLNIGIGTTGAGTFRFFRMDTSGGLANSIDITYVAGTWYRWRIRLVGTSIKGRLWVDGTPEPSTWAIDFTDSLFSGPGDIYIGSASFSSGNIFSFDDLLVQSWDIVSPSAANTAEGGTNGAAITVGTSGGASGDPFEIVNGTPAWSNLHPATGSMGIDMYSGLGNTTRVGHSRGFGQTVYGRYYVYTDVLVGGSTTYIEVQDAAIAYLGIIEALSPTGKVVLYNASLSVVATSAITLAVNTLYRIEYKLVSHASAGTIEARIYVGHSTTPVETLIATGLNTRGTAIAHVKYTHEASASTVSHSWIDDLNANTAGFPGPSGSIQSVGPLVTTDSAINDGSFIYGAGGTLEEASQTVQLFAGTTISSVEVQSFLTGGAGSMSDNATVSIQADAGGTPSGTVLTSGSLPGNNISTTNLSWHAIPVTPWVVPTTGLYWVIFGRSGARDTVHYWTVQGTAGSGKLYPVGNFRTKNSGVWSAPYNGGYSCLNIVIPYTGAASLGQRGSTYADEATIWGGSGTNQRGAQTFVLPVACSVLTVKIFGITNASPTDDLVVALQADVAGAPSGTDLCSRALNMEFWGNLGGALRWFTFDQSANSLAAGTYWIIIRRSGARDTTNYFLAVGSASTYAGGTAYGDSSGTWTPKSIDLNFEVIYQVGGTTPVVVADSGSASDIALSLGKTVVDSAVATDAAGPPGLLDDFNTADATKWDHGGTATVTGGRLRHTLDSGYGWSASKRYFNLTGAEARVRIDQLDSIAADVNVALNVAFDTFNRTGSTYSYNNMAWLLLVNPAGGGMVLRAMKKAAGVDSQVGSSVAYNAATMKWLRVREAGGTLFYDYSADAVSWTNLTSTAVWFSVTTTMLELFAGCDSANVGFVYFDDAALTATPAVPAVAAAIPVTDSGSGADTAPTLGKTVADSATAVDTALVSTGTTPVNVSDSAVGTDTSDLARPVSDSAVGADASALTAAIPVTDSGAGADTAAIDKAVSDAAVGVDVSALTAAIPVTDTGTGADTAPSVAKPGTDAAVGADASALTATYAVSDTAVGADASSVTIGVSDSAVGTDTSAINKLVSDAATGVDASSLTAALPVTDAGTAVDSSGLTAPFTVTDAGVGVDASLLAAALTVSDAATGADTSALTAAPTVSDSAAGADTSSLTTGNVVNVVDSGAVSDVSAATAALPVTDAATGSDVSSLAAALPVLDTAAGADTSAINKLVSDSAVSSDVSDLARPVTDSATGSDTSAINKLVADTAVGTDVVGTIPATVSVNDAAVGSDTSALSTANQKSVNEVGVAVDTSATTATNTVADSGSSVDLVAETVLWSRTDAAVGADASAVTATLTVTDAAVGADASALTSPISVTDSGASADTSAINKAVSDAGTGSDAITTVAKAVTDAGTAADVSSLITGTAVNVFDSATGTDTAATTAVLTAQDTAAGLDTAALSVLWSRSDSAVGVDTSQVVIAIAVQDQATGLDTSQIRVALAVLDQGLGVDVAVLAAQVFKTVSDAGHAVDIATVRAGLPEAIELLARFSPVMVARARFDPHLELVGRLRAELVQRGRYTPVVERDARLDPEASMAGSRA